METKTITMLRAHETMKLDDGTEIMRVPGGYLYTKNKQTVFVAKAYEQEFELTLEQKRQFLNEKLERNLGENWTNAKKEDIIDVILGEYVPF